MRELLDSLLFLPERASTFAERVDALHYFVISVTMVASAGVGLAALYFFFRFRQDRPGQATAYVVPSRKTEFLFVSVPMVFFLAWFAMGFRDFISYFTPPRDAMDVYVMGKQWMWKFSYPDGPNGVSVLHVPEGRPVRLLLTSRDVVHSFFVPAFRAKMDVLPGRYTQLWFEATRPGVYPVLCTEYCGLSHSRMRAEVVVLPQDRFNAWLEQQRRGNLANRQDALAEPTLVPPSANMLTLGKDLVATEGCLKCHTLDGERHIGPTFLGMYGRQERLEGGRLLQVDEAYITQSMMDPGAHLVDGYDNVMPTYQGRLTGPQTAAIVEFLKSLSTPGVRSGPSEGPLYEPTIQP